MPESAADLAAQFAREATPEIAVQLRTLVLRMGEIWLRGRNRNAFKRRLQRNLMATLRARIPKANVFLRRTRLIVEIPDAAAMPEALAICRDTPGVTWVSPAIPVAPTVEAIEAASQQLAQQAWAGATGSFMIETRRTDKQFPLKSSALNARIGAQIASALGLGVDLRTPDRVLGIDITHQQAHVYVQRLKGVGGLPVGSAGRVMLLLSGGLDSPVAGYHAQRRGCELEAVYFHSPPFISEASKDKVIALARILAPRQGQLRFSVVPFTKVQLAIRDAAGGRFTVLLYRRFMYRIAAQLARNRNIPALCTGENLAQVASQTLQNLGLVDQATDMLCLRPLISADKNEIVTQARRIGTYETSILPHDDCCTLFIPPDPATRAPLSSVERREAELDVEGLVADAIARTEVIVINTLPPASAREPSAIEP